MKFDSTLSKMYKVILEADAPPADPQSMTAGPGPVGPQNGEAPPADATEPTDDPTAGDPSALTSQGEVMLIRLIAKALTIKPSTEDLIDIVGLKDINEKNANDVLKKLMGVIRKYSDTNTI